QRDCVVLDLTTGRSVMRLALKRCKDNAALRQSRAVMRPCGQSRNAQFRDNAAAADGHASLLLLSQDLCAPMRRHTRAECCLRQERSWVVRKVGACLRPAILDAKNSVRRQ